MNAPMHATRPQMHAARPEQRAAPGPSLDLDLWNVDKADAVKGKSSTTVTAWNRNLISLLNDALATELVCLLRYRRHYFTAAGQASAAIAEAFLVHANEELGHADRLATRIVQLGGEPDLSPDSLTAKSHASYDAPKSLNEMIHSNLIAELVAIEAYRQMITQVGGKDPTTRRMLEEILQIEEEHAEELKHWLTP